MKLENQVCSLELAKKLKTLGVKQESLFVYLSDIVFYRGQVSGRSIPLVEGEWYAAFTVAELGEMLPKLIRGGGRLVQMSEANIIQGSFWSISYENLEEIIIDISEVNARTRLLIYLIERNLIKI